jgi:hypothetical protein
MGLKRFSNRIFLKRNLAAWLQKTVDNKSSVAKRVLVFSDDTEIKEEVLTELTSILGISSEAIDLIVFQRKKPKDQQGDHIIDSYDFGWYGQLKSEKLKNILTNKYDLLINYCKVDNLYSILLLLQSKTALKVGFGHFDTRFYDLLIKCDPSDRGLFNNELEKYLKVLNKI